MLNHKFFDIINIKISLIDTFRILLCCLYLFSFIDLPVVSIFNKIILG